MAALLVSISPSRATTPEDARRTDGSGKFLVAGTGRYAHACCVEKFT
jgi:hypothetical protein